MFAASILASGLVYRRFSNENDLFFRSISRQHAHSIMSQWMLEFQFQDGDAVPTTDVDVRYTDDSISGPFRLHQAGESENSDIVMLSEVMEWTKTDDELELYSLAHAQDGENHILSMLKYEEDCMKVYGFCISPTTEYETRDLCSLMALEILTLASDLETSLTFL